MMGWLYYLLEANLYLMLFYGFYRLFLHRETFYELNRYYLIFSTILAYLLPFFQLGFLKKDIIGGYNENIHIQDTAPLLSAANVCLSIYIIICLILSLKIFWGLRHIKKLTRNAKKRKENGITIIEIDHSKIAFSFFNLLFIDPEMNQKDTVLKHEMVHIKQKHSIDILFFELIQISSWFNPVTYFIKNDIKLIHEYLADEATTQKDIAKYEYALFLIQNSYGNQEVKLSNQFFNSSLLKNRISMLNQKKSAKWARLRLLLVLPVVGGMLCTSTMALTKNYTVVDLFPKKVTALNIKLQDTVKRPKAKEIVIAEPVPQVKQVRSVKLAPPPPIEPAPKSKSAKKQMKSVAPPPPPMEPKSAKGEILEIKLSPPPPPVEPGTLKGKKPTQTKVGQVRFAPPVVTKDKKNLPVPPPPPVEPKTKKSSGK
ncbi:M56 family metallopeptidase [Pedobacter miscanthi]|uniref:M56 family metallopeptidase n=1 Tax=Pedobacter miscanthi TaxID=2259170 RepID=UPI002930FA17|nr:M56 family metallopeptidase [Pedobacter miscanthi]